jgi:hypothetical protein
LMSINNRHPSQAADCRHMRVPPQPTEPASEAILASTMQPDRDNHGTGIIDEVCASSASGF